jgi:ABC-type transporter Mla subunit MlaD
MPLQDLTPQLRTRLSHMERAVGWFVVVAVALLLFGFGYYVYTTAERKGWFKHKAHYYTFVDAATGLKVGDPVRLMGLDVGQIVRIDPQPPEDFEYNMYIEFQIKEPYYGYLWTIGSRAKVASADLLGKRVLEVTKGEGGHESYIFNPLRIVRTEEARSLPEWEKWRLAQDIYDVSGTNLVAQAGWSIATNLDRISQLGLKEIRLADGRKENRQKEITGVWNDQQGEYDSFHGTNLYWLKSDESPALTERLDDLVKQVEGGLPGILNLTNQLGNVLSNTASLTSNLTAVTSSLRPAATNLALATARLDQPGGLGEWLLPTNINHQLEGVLTTANTTVAGVNTNLNSTFEAIGRSLDNLANITSNLNSQVQANNNMLTQLSRTVVDTDDLVQGLKRHWLLRSAFKTKKPEEKPAPKQSKTQNLRPPKE